MVDWFGCHSHTMGIRLVFETVALWEVEVEAECSVMQDFYFDL